MIFMIDNYDSFAHNLARYVRLQGMDCAVVRHDAITADDVIAMDPTAVIISPGPCTPHDAGISLDVIRKADERLPILGVCLGHQCIAQAHGGRIKHAEKPVHGKATQIQHDGRGIFQYIPSPLTVGRYHSLIADLDPKGPLVATAQTVCETPEVMALAHRTLPQVGIQFHPESMLTAHGASLMQNFISFAQGWRRSQALAEAAQ